jgi:hypothetical protein
MRTTLLHMVRNRSKKKICFSARLLCIPTLLCPDKLFTSLPLTAYLTQSENASLLLETTFREFIKYLRMRLYLCGAPIKIAHSVCKHATTRETLKRFLRTFGNVGSFLHFVIRFQTWLHRIKTTDALHDSYAFLSPCEAQISKYLSELNMFPSNRCCKENLNTHP